MNQSSAKVADDWCSTPHGPELEGMECVFFNWMNLTMQRNMLNLKTLLRVLILSDVLIYVLSIYVLFERGLSFSSEVVSDYESSVSIFVAATNSGLAILTLLSWVSLWFVMNWGRWLYTVLTVISLAVTLSTFAVACGEDAPIFQLPTIVSLEQYAIVILSFACSAGILGLVWFSNLKVEFKHTPAPTITKI